MYTSKTNVSNGIDAPTRNGIDLNMRFGTRANILKFSNQRRTIGSWTQERYRRRAYPIIAQGSLRREPEVAERNRDQT
jgi:hypothetical protein